MKQLKLIVSALVLLMVITSHQTYAQKSKVFETSVKGVVVESATGKPISGVQVVIPGVASTITDESGKFELNKSVDGAILVISSPGYASRQIAVLGKSNLKIKLIDETFRGKYEDIVLPFDVKNAYSSPYAVSTHENRDDYKLGYSSIESVFQGNLNGLNAVSKSGMPGSGANLYLNGFNSLNANNQPLLIVDGVQFDNPVIHSLITGNNITALTDFDIRDIDKITVLKDGASLYGSKGSNGVILINTIRAKGPATRINFYAYAGINQETETKYRMMDSWSYKNYLTDMLLTKGMTTAQIQSLPYINAVKPVVENWGISGNKDYYRYNQNTNWQDEVLNSSINQNYHLNVSGGNDVILYAIGVGFLNHGGAVENTGFSRYSFRTNASIKMTNWFKMNANVSYINSERTLAFEGMNRNFNPLYAGLLKSPFTAPYVYNVTGEVTPNLENADIFNVSNPAAIIKNGSATNNRSRFTGVLNGNLTLSKYLKGDITVGLTSDKVTTERVFMPQAGIYHTPLPSSDVTNESMQLRNNLSHFTLEGRLSYERNFNKIHDIAARAGFRFISAKSELDWGQAFNTSSDEMQTLGDGVNALAKIGGSLGIWRSVSDYVNVDYAFKNKFLLSLNAALDGSSRFGSEADGIKIMNQVFGFFPSVNGAWILTGEDFMKNQSFFDVLKIRSGYSLTGNDDIGNYSSRYYYIPQSYLGAYGLVRGNIPNASLKWETNRKVTFGVDASMFGEKLNVSVDLYQSVTSDLIQINSLESYTGISSAVSNDGSLKNQGVDVAVNSRLIDRKSLKWDLGINISTNQSELLAMSVNEKYNEIAGASVLTKVGSPLVQFWGYKTDGILNSAQEATDAGLSIQNTDGTLIPFTAGDVKFVDLDGNHIINEEDKTVIGNPLPDFTGSVNSTVYWKNFSLNAICSFAYGNDVYNAVRASLESYSGYENQTITANSRWKYDGQQTNTPRAVWGDPMGNARFSDRWIEDGSFIRLKSVTLTYDVPVSSRVITGAQIYVTGNNLLTFTNYLGFDPEFSTGQSVYYYGIDRGVTPQPRTVLIGVKIGL